LRDKKRIAYEKQFEDIDRSFKHEQEFEARPEVECEIKGSEEETAWERKVTT
jgi:hypothetical protein